MREGRNDWDIEIEYAANVPFEVALRELAEMDSPYVRGIKLVDNGRVLVRIHVAQKGVNAALRAAFYSMRCLKAFKEASVHALYVTQVGATHCTPQLAGLAEVATMLNVSKQRASQIAARSDFPRPQIQFAMGPAWTRSSVVQFQQSADATKRSRRSVQVKKPGAHLLTHVRQMPTDEPAPMSDSQFKNMVITAFEAGLSTRTPGAGRRDSST
jgi:hypothetical protein